MVMTLKISTSIALLSLLVLGLILPVHAALNTISQGNIVFIGEYGLDVSGAMGVDSKIGWWGSGASISSTAPTQVLTIGTPTNFAITPAEFSGYTGNWYRLDNAGKADGTAFNVQDPSLAIRVEDVTLNLDRTNDWVPTGDVVRFAIDSNLYAVASDRGAGAPVTIHLLSPNGGEYSSVVGPGGASHSIVDVPVTTTPFLSDSLGILWDTGNSLYSQGTYQVYAECTLNGMKDNYPATGKSISNRITALDQDVNPLIKSGGSNPSITAHVPTTVKTSVPTTVPPTVTTVPTTIPPPSIPTTIITTETPATPVPVTTTPIPATTKAPGFGLMLTLSSIAVGLMVCLRK